ncbi:MAG TPA: ABC transporter ATP-binding protein [Clostridia bacterium]|jgi:branched-chain amino acid transport system ATP-binding protein|nr:ABC transporter ATP-binding protein [Clostridia bacterium]
MKEIEIPLLETQAITMRFGGVTAVNSLSIEVYPGEIVALIGPNGAGKTTAFNMITGVYTPTEGRIMFEGRDITGKRPDQITSLGIARTFQNIRLFKKLSVLENILIACHLRIRSNFFSASVRMPRYRKEEKVMREKADYLIEEFGLSRYKDEIASSLPYGLQRRLEIARALATEPHLLLLDEPAAGMNPKETEELTSFIREIKEKNDLTVFLIEHHMDLVMEISERIYVLDFGETIAKGTASEVQNNPRVIEAYLGVDEDA